MKVLYVVNSLANGGAERQLANLLDPLSRMGVESYLATLQARNANEGRVLPFLAGYEPALLDRGTVAALPRLVNLARDVDIVHTHLPWSDIAGRLAATVAGKPVFSTFHSTWYDRDLLRALPRAARGKAHIVRALDALTARFASGFFAVSQAAKDSHVDALGISPDRVVVVPNTINLSEFDPTKFPDREATRAELGFLRDELAIVTVARLYPPKDQATAILAVSRLAMELPVHLYLVGDGPLEPGLRALARKHRAPVTFLGARPDVARILAASDLFLLPTFFEGYSLALMEGMAMGLACVASDVPANRETGGDAVTYVPPGNAPALARCLREILTDHGRRAAMSELARLRAQEFDIARAARAILAIYRQALDKSFLTPS